MAKYEEPVNHFDMDLKGVYKVNKAAHLRLNIYINTLEKRQEQTMVKLDHDIRETKRKLDSIENEKNKLVMKLLKTYVNKTTSSRQKKRRLPNVPESVVQSRSGVNTAFTFSTYLDIPESTALSGYHPSASYYKRPRTIQFPYSESRLGSEQTGKAFSDFGISTRKLFSRDTNQNGIQSRASKIPDSARDIQSRFSSQRDIHSRTTKRDIRSPMSKISDLPATRGQLHGAEHSEHTHNKKLKEMLGGNTCLFRGHRPMKGYYVEPPNKRTRGILPSEIHPDDYIAPSKLLERIKVFGDIKLPHIKQNVVKQNASRTSRSLKPTLPTILSNINTVTPSQTKKQRTLLPFRNLGDV